MTKKTTSQPKSAELTPEGILSGIKKLERRIKELEEFEISTIKVL